MSSGWGRSMAETSLRGMMRESMRNRIVVVLVGLGLLVAILSGLAEWVSWLDAFCASFSDGCKETARVTLLRLPIWIWGIGLYGLLLVCFFRIRSWFFLVVSAGVGVEVTLVWIMFSMQAFCIFCLSNLLIIFLILAFSMQRESIWRSVSACLAFFIASHLIIPYENGLHASHRSQDQEDADVLAKVGGETISTEHLGVAVASRVLELEKEIYRAKREQIDQMVAERIFRKEADQQGISLEEYVNKKLAEIPVEVGEQEIDTYYQENLGRWRDWKGTMEDLRARIRTYLEQQKRYAELMKHASSLESKYGVAVYIKEPTVRVSKVNIEGSHAVGPPDAPVMVVEFSDYQCPACRSGHSVVMTLREAYKGKIRWVFKDFPLKRHKDAAAAAEAARCAGDQNRFWDYQDVLYGSQEEFTPEKFEQFAKQLGLNSDVFRQCVQSGKFKSHVENDIAEAKRIGVDRTPSFIINGKLTTGVPAYEDFKKIVDAELRKGKQGS
jgi:protein-disulfide isomerase